MQSIPSSLSRLEIEQIRNCNLQLAVLEVQMIRFFEDKKLSHAVPAISAHQSQERGETVKYVDFEKYAEIDFRLREDVPNFLPDDDNILTTREVALTRCHPFWADGMDHGREFSELQRYGIGPVCWLFHELYHHDYGSGRQSLTLQDISRIGSVWIDVFTVDQFEMEMA